MRGIPPSPSWYSAHLACATSRGDIFAYASDKAIVAIEGERGRVIWRRNGKARANALCEALGECEESGAQKRVFACGCADKTIRVFDVEDGSARGGGLSGGHRHEVSAISAHGIGRIASGCRDGTVAVWRISSDGSGSLESSHRGMDGPITAMASTGDVIAVGGANGTVCALDPSTGSTHRVATSGYGEVTSLSWTRTRTSDGQTKELLAVGSRERRVTIWALDEGKLVNSHALLLPKPTTALSEAQRGRVWVAVAWTDASDETFAELVTSGQGGDLLLWRVPLTFGDGIEEVKQAKTFGPRDAAHTRTVFTVTTADDKCWSTSLDRKVACWDLETIEMRWSYTALGGYVYDLTTAADDPFSVAIACGDGTVHAWDLSPTLSCDMGESVLWKGIPNTKVTSVARKPKSDVVAFGLDDGRVGCFDSTSGKFACYPECHGASVHQLKWLEIRTEGEEQGVFSLTSLGADGSLRRWLETFEPSTCDTKKSGIADARKYGKYLDLAQLCQGVGSSENKYIETFDQSPVVGRLACGWSTGELSGHDFGEVLWQHREHSKSVSRVRWHPESDDASSQYSSWLASSSTSGSILIHGIGGSVLCALPRASVHDIAWSPRANVAILACALHGSVKIWSVDKVAHDFNLSNLAVLHGHVGKVMCVKFAYHDDNIVLSGGDDKTFRIWNYTDTDHAPRDAETSAIKLGASFTDDIVVEQPSKAPSAKKSSSSVKSKAPKSTGISGPLLKPPQGENTPEGIEVGRAAVLALARRVFKGEATDEVASDTLTYGPSGTALYEDTDAAMALLSNEAESASRNANSFKDVERAVALHIYQGDYARAALTLLKASDSPLPSEFMSIFVGGGYEVWSTVAAAQCERLAAAGEFQQAAMLRLSLHDVRGAIRTLRQGGMIRDAAALAAARLLPTDELLLETRHELAAAEETRGGMEAAAKTHISLGNAAAAVRALMRPEVGGALAAAKLALMCNLTGPQERRTVVRAAIELAEKDNYTDAMDLLSELSDILRRDGHDVDVTAAVIGTANAPEVAAELARRLAVASI